MLNMPHKKEGDQFRPNVCNQNCSSYLKIKVLIFFRGRDMFSSFSAFACDLLNVSKWPNLNPIKSFFLLAYNPPDPAKTLKVNTSKMRYIFLRKPFSGFYKGNHRQHEKLTQICKNLHKHGLCVVPGLMAM